MVVKKLLSVILLLLCTMVICGCGDVVGNSPAEQKNKEIITAYLKTGTQEDDNDINSNSVYFQNKEYTSVLAKNKVSIMVSEEKYNAKYTNSISLSYCDIEANVYTVNNLENTKILIDSKDGEIIKYHNFPYNENLKNERDYINFIEELVGEKTDLSKYDYKCTTHYYVKSEQMTRSTVDDGFLDGNYDRTIGTYSFYFTKKINNVKSMEHVTAEFYKDIEGNKVFTLEIYDLQYEEGIFGEILDKMPDVQNNIQSFVKNTFGKDKKIINVSVDGCRLFVKNGKVYLMSTPFVEWENGGVTYSSALQTVSWLE